MFTRHVISSKSLIIARQIKRANAMPKNGTLAVTFTDDHARSAGHRG